MADGYARVSGRHGVVIGQNGPGISNCVTAIAAAYWAHSPVVIVTPETGTMGMGLGGFQEANQLPMFQEFTKYQGHVNNPKRMAEFTGRCFDRAMSEMGPTQLNIPRDYFYGDITCEIPKPFRLDRGPRRRADPERSRRAAGHGQVPRHHLRRRRGDGRRRRGMQGAGRAPGRAGGEQLPAQRLLPRQPPAVVRPAGLPGLEGGDEADRPGRRGDRAGQPPRPLRHPAAARHGLLAQGCQDHPDRRRQHHAGPGEEDLGRHLRRRQGRRRGADPAPGGPHAGLRRHQGRARRQDQGREGRVGERSSTTGPTSATPTAWT
jgi:hypothetical protein